MTSMDEDREQKEAEHQASPAECQRRNTIRQRTPLRTEMAMEVHAQPRSLAWTCQALLGITLRTCQGLLGITLREEDGPAEGKSVVRKAAMPGGSREDVTSATSCQRPCEGSSQHWQPGGCELRALETVRSCGSTRIVIGADLASDKKDLPSGPCRPLVSRRAI